ncbi:MAG: helix-turn-helix domain-containing protein [Anaerolineae bacterium]|nr:helix-turn-helix domain-containing protein [Anaerolineae bacterium]
MGIFKHLQDEVQEREKREGITLADLLELDSSLRRVMNRVTRYGEMTVPQAVELLEDTPENVTQMLNTLAEKGYLLREKGPEGWVYRVHLARKRGTSLPPGVWSALGSQLQPEPSDAPDEDSEDVVETEAP